MLFDESKNGGVFLGVVNHINLLVFQDFTILFLMPQNTTPLRLLTFVHFFGLFKKVQNKRF